MKYVILAILALFMCTQIGWSYQSSQEFISVAVEPGQTVWQLARLQPVMIRMCVKSWIRF